MPAAPMVGKLYTQYRQTGWSERYYLGQIEYADALAKMDTLVKYRTLFFASGIEVSWACVSVLGNPREAAGLEGLPMSFDQGVVAPDVPEDPFTALHLRFETADAKWGSRLWRGLPDTMVEDFRVRGVFPTPLAAGAALSPPRGGAASLLQRQRSFLSWLIANTFHGKRTAVGPPQVWAFTPWTRILARRVSNRKTGRPFGLFRGRAPKMLAVAP